MIGRHLGHYEITGELGRGGMATVYQARQIGLDRMVALKILHPALAEDDTIIRRFEQEARIAANLYHPNILTIYDVGSADGVLFIAMRYVQGETLAQLLRRERPLDPTRGLKMVAQVAAALDFAHSRGVLHRDVKPANALVEPGDVVTLTDFGIARASEGAALTSTRMVIGTPEYMSPEQSRGDPMDHRTDLYALGVMLYEVLSGRPPFSAANTPALLYKHVHEAPPPINQIRPELPAALGDVLNKALAKEPDDRFMSGREMMAAAEVALGAGTLPPPSTTPAVTPAVTTILPSSAVPPPTRPLPSDTRRQQPPTVAGSTTVTPPPIRPLATTGQTAAQPTRGSLTSTGERPRSPLPWIIGAGVAFLLVGGGVAGWLANRGADSPAAKPTVTTAPAKPTGVLAAPSPAASPVVAVKPAAPAPPSPVAQAVPSPAVAPAPAKPAGPSPAEIVSGAQALAGRGEHPAALATLTAVKRAGNAPPTIDEAMYQAYMGAAKARLDVGDYGAATANYTEAEKIRPGDAGAREGLKQAGLGTQWALMESNWSANPEAAIEAAEKIVAVDANYRDVKQKLYALLISKADRQIGSDRQGAFRSLTRALELVPEGAEAKQRLQQFTPTPVPPPPPPQPQPQPKPQTQPTRPPPRPGQPL
jgi:serine/threonine-protein kinase